MSQDKFNRFFFSASVGLANPFGKFAAYRRFESSVPYTPANYIGAPKAGVGYKIEGMYLFMKYLGLTCSYYRTINETPALTEEQVFPDNTAGGLGGGSNNTSFSYWAGNWQTHNLLIGLVLQADGRYVEMRLRLSGGWQQIKTPEVRIYGNAVDWTTSPPVFVYYSFSNQQMSATSKAFVVNPGADLRVRIRKGLGIMIGIDIFSSHSDFKLNTIHKTSGGYNTVDHGESTVTKSITFFCFNGGICYVLP